MADILSLAVMDSRDISPSTQAEDGRMPTFPKSGSQSRRRWGMTVRSGIRFRSVAAALIMCGVPLTELAIDRHSASRAFAQSPAESDAITAAASPLPAPDSTPRPQPVRSRKVEMHYQLAGASEEALVALWYTRDLGATWVRYGLDLDGESPFLFEAPAEGLYGISLLPDDGRHLHGPSEIARPQRWLFLDDTPPLVQWDRVEPADDFAVKRELRLGWTAHDSHFPARPVALMYQSSLDQKWRMIEREWPNSGRYLWTVPKEVTGQVALKIVVRDRGGHAVERVFGPVPVARWQAIPTTSQPAATEAPSDRPTTQPAFDPVSAAHRQRAEQLYRQGALHRRRGQYDLASVRLKEALEHNPNHLSALNDLAGLNYLGENYDDAIAGYLDVLRRDDDHVNALRGAALAYMARRDYPNSKAMLQRVLAVQETDAQSWLDLGDVLFMMGDVSQARSSWEQAGLNDDTEAASITARARQRLSRLKPTASRLESVVPPEAQASSSR